MALTLWLVVGGWPQLDGQLKHDRGALRGPTVEADGAPERLCPIDQADDSRPRARLGAAEAVVADRETQCAVAELEGYADDGRLGVLGGVGQRL